MTRERWTTLVGTMLAESQATYGASGSSAQRAFGSTSLKTNGKIFAMLVNGRLVVKLDRRRVDELVASDETWLELATESEAFVASRRP